MEAQEQRLSNKLAAQEQRLSNKLAAQEQRFNDKLDAREERLNTKIEAQNAQLLENQTAQMNMRYEHDVDSKLKALKEEAAVVRDDIKDHEQRIYAVERKVGLAI